MGPKRRHILWVDYSETSGSENQAESMATRNNKVHVCHLKGSSLHNLVSSVENFCKQFGPQEIS